VFDVRPTGVERGCHTYSDRNRGSLGRANYWGERLIQSGVRPRPAHLCLLLLWCPRQALGPTARAALMAAIYLVTYLAHSVPAIRAGYLVTQIGLHDAALWSGGGAGLLALAGLTGTLFVRHLARARALSAAGDPQLA